MQKSRQSFFRHTLFASMAVATQLASVAALAQSNSAVTFSGAIEAGAEYNSNVSVPELETASGTGDMAATADARLDMNWKPVERLSVDAGYSFSAQRYQDVDIFDLDMHLVYADASYDFDVFTIGANHYYADADLGGRDFLILKQTSVYAGKMIGEQIYLRGAINTADKSFTGLAARNAKTEGVSVDAFWFFNQGRSSMSFGYAWDDEEARAREFAYEADTLRVRYNNRFDLFGKDSDLQIGLRTQHRDYKGITPAIGVPRNDRQTVADARLKVQLNPVLAVSGKLERGDFSSHLPSADYTENRVSLSLQASF